MGKIRGRRATTKKPKAFTYGRRGGNQAAQFGYLNFIQTQAHNIQVDALLREVNQAQAFTKRAVKEALDSVYDRSGPMDVDPRPRFPPAPQPPTERRMTNAATRNPFGGDATLSFGQEIRRLAARSNLLYRNRVARETPSDMEGVEATLSRAAPPATVEAFKFMSYGPQNLKGLVNDSEKYQNLRRLNKLHRESHTSSVPTQEAIATEREARGKRMAEATNAAMAGSTYPTFNPLDTDILVEDQYKPVGRDFKAPRIIPGVNNGVAPFRGVESYFENRLPPRVRSHREENMIM